MSVRNQKIQSAARVFALFACGAMLSMQATFADVHQWNSGSGNWNTSGNWFSFPNTGVPAPGDAVLIGNLAAAQFAIVTLNTSYDPANPLASVTITNGADLRTNGFQLTVAGDITLDEDVANVVLRVDRGVLSDDVDTDDLNVLNGAQVLMNEGILEIDNLMTVDEFSFLNGEGVLDFEQAGGIGLSLSGTLTTTGAGLVLNSNNGATFDLDGSSGGDSVINVQAGIGANASDLTVNGSLSDSFSGTMNIGADNTVTMTNGWSSDASAVINIVGASNSVSTIAGGLYSSLSDINVSGNGTARFAGNVNFNGGTVDVASGSTLRLDGTTTFAAGATLTLAGGGNSNLIVNGNTTINQAVFDWDSVGGGVNTTTIGTNGLLTINSDTLDTGNDNYEGTVNIQGGGLHVNVNASEWTMDGTMNLTGTSTITGRKMGVTGDLNADSGSSVIGVSTDFDSGASLIVDNGATLTINGAGTSVRFEPGSKATVNGTLVLDGTAATTWTAPTTVAGTGTIRQEMNAIITGGETVINTAVYDWDGLAGGGFSNTSINSTGTLTINAEIEAGVDETFDGDLLVNGILNVNNQPWVANGSSITSSSSVGQINGQRLTIQGAGSELKTLGTLTFGADLDLDSNVDVRLLTIGARMNFNGEVELNGTTMNADFSPARVVFNNGLVTASGSSVINVPEVDLDGDLGLNSSVTINTGASLTINTDTIDPGNQGGYIGDININGGRLEVNTLADWRPGRDINLNTVTGAVTVAGSQISTNRVTHIDATGGGTANFTAPVSLGNGATTTIAASTILRFDNVVDFENTVVSGSGTLGFDSTASIQNGALIVVGAVDLQDNGVVTMDDGDVITTSLTKHASGSLDLNGGTFVVNAGDALFNSSFAYGGPALTAPEFRVTNGGDVAVNFSWIVANGAGDMANTLVSGTNADGSRRSTIRGTGGGGGADLIVGNSGSGSMTIEDGGLVFLRDDAYVGDDAGSDSDLTVTGVRNAGGNLVRSELRVTGNGGSSTIDVGRAGIGELNIANGALVQTSGDLNVGNVAGGQGTVNIGGATMGHSAEVAVADDIVIGSAGEGEFNLNAGGKVTGDVMSVFSNGVTNMSGGELTLNTLDLDTNGGSFNMTGGVLHAGTVVGDLRPDGGVVAPGTSPGTTIVTGLYEQDAAASLEIEIGGPTAGDDFDVLDVTGAAILAGTLNVLLIDLGGGVYAPSAGETFEIVKSFAGIAGEFDTELLPALSGELTWAVNYGDNNVVLEVLSSFLESDFDMDGDVDGDDFLVWQSNFGGPGPDGDADNDGDVDGDDFLLWQSQFGSGGGSTGIARSAVPEPATAILFAVAAAMGFAVRRVKKFQAA